MSLVIPPYVFPDRNTPNVTPLTYRDGITYLQKLELLRVLINKLNEYVQDSDTEISNVLEGQINDLAERVNAAIQLVIDNSIEVQEPVVEQIIADSNSAVRDLLNGLYASHSVQDTVETGRLSDNSVTNKIDGLVKINNRVQRANQTTGFGSLIHSIIKSRDSRGLIVFAGSSTTAWGETWIRVVLSAIAKSKAAPADIDAGWRYLNGLGALVNDSSTRAGVAGLNVGRGGATALDYLDPATISEIASRFPVAWVHQVGSNDWANGYTPVEYRANLSDKIALIESASGVKPAHLFIHSQDRYDTTPAYTWDQFAAAMEDVARSVPDGRGSFIDASQFFRAAGLPVSNVYGYMDSDKIHLTPKGQGALGRFLAHELRLETPDTRQFPNHPITNVVLSSDNFDDGTTFVGRTPNNALGGFQSSPYVDSTGGQGWTIDGGRLKWANNAVTGFMGIPVPGGASTGISFRISAMPESGNATLIDLNRNAVSTSPSVRLGFSTVNFQIIKRHLINGSIGDTVLAEFSYDNFPVGVGDRILFYRYRDAVRLYINDRFFSEVTVPAGEVGYDGYAGFARGNPDVGMMIDNVAFWIYP